MVQIGNYHVGRAETANKPALDTGEAFLLWDLLLSRYDIISKTQIYQNFAHDPDFKYVLTKGLQDVLEVQTDKLERELNTYEITLPVRPPKSVRLPAQSAIMNDEMMFRDVLFGIQGFLDYHGRVIRSIITSDGLRHMIVDFSIQEINTFNGLVKFGKAKGWLKVPPMFKA